MLLFIGRNSSFSSFLAKFQYISCYSLSARTKADYIQMIMFQYISCYSLSYKACKLHIRPERFNTSHVTLYQSARNLVWSLMRVSIHLMLLFISDATVSRTRKHTRFNTSHVTLYLILPQLLICGNASFNTSHVTLYQ